MSSINSFNAQATLKVGTHTYTYYSLQALEKAGLGSLKSLPYSLKVLLENLLRHEDGKQVTKADIEAVVKGSQENIEIAFSPARVLMQDFTGVPAIVDLAAMRDAMKALQEDPERINPLIPVDLVIDHSVMVDSFGSKEAFHINTELEYERNAERYAFLRWGQNAFENFRVVPPGTGICHQVNLEYLAQVVWTKKLKDDTFLAYPDTLVGTDSHTTMVNGMAVLGWGVGGIEAEAAMLGQPISMLVPKVVGFKLMGTLPEGATATDLVLTITHMLRSKGVVGKFVEFFGPGMDNLSLADRATIANMAPEYGATCGYFPIDKETLRYLTLTARDPEQVQLVESYAKAQGLWRDEHTADPVFDEQMSLELDTIRPTLAGPKRPQDSIFLNNVKASCVEGLRQDNKDLTKSWPVQGSDLAHGHVMIASITSCTNTSNPAVMLAAGLLAQKAWQKGLTPKPWVKTSLAPGSQVVTDYLAKAGLDKPLDALGFQLVGYGCTTCIGNSGALAPQWAQAIEEHDLTVAGVLSGNRNFEGRINPHVKLNYLASPPLVVAYALAGTVRINFDTDPIGHDTLGAPVYLKDIWPSNQEIQQAIEQFMTPDMYKSRYSQVFLGDARWQSIPNHDSVTYPWDDNSTYVKNPPYFTKMDQAGPQALSIEGAHVLALLGDSVTTDHISPAGNIKQASPAGDYLGKKQVKSQDFNSYGSRRGNHEVMMRGTFANIRLNNEMVPEKTGGLTRLTPNGEIISIFQASSYYQEQQIPLIIIAGKEYGTGSSRDWAAKGTKLLGIQAVIAESFERIHRSNLVGMGVVPLVFPTNVNRQTLGLTGFETITLKGMSEGIQPGMDVLCEITTPQGDILSIILKCRIDTQEEVSYFTQGGILPYVLKGLQA